MRRQGEIASGLAFTPDGDRLVSGGADRAIHVWETRLAAPIYDHPFHVGRLSTSRFRELRRLVGHERGVSQLEVSPDGRWIVSLAEDGVVKFWHIGAADTIATLDGHDDTVHGLAFDPGNPDVLMSCDGSGAVYTWDLVTARPLKLRYTGLRSCFGLVTGHQT